MTEFGEMFLAIRKRLKKSKDVDLKGRNVKDLFEQSVEELVASSLQIKFCKLDDCSLAGLTLRQVNYVILLGLLGGLELNIDYLSLRIFAEGLFKI